MTGSRTPPGRAADSVELLAAFPGASIGEARWQDGRLSLALRQEPTVRADWTRHDYGIHFVFGVRNRSAERVVVPVRVGSPAGEICRLCPGRLYTSGRPDAEFVACDLAATTDHRGYSEWTLELGPHETKYWANTLWRPLEAISDRFGQLAAAAGLEGRSFGTTVEGRPLTVFESQRGGAERPAILVTSGIHPMEGDTVGTEALLRWLAGEGSNVLHGWNVVVVPVANPDGFVHGHNGCNATGINFFWDFRDDDRTRCPEAYYLLELVKAVRPLVHVDFHSYSIQGPRKRPGPYIVPQLFYAGDRARRLAADLAQSLGEIPGTTGQTVLAPSSLPFRITRRLNSVMFAKYHLHQDLGRAAMGELAVKVIRTIVAVLDSRRVRPEQVLLEPYGRVRRNALDRIRQSVYTLRYMIPRAMRYS